MFQGKIVLVVEDDKIPRESTCQALSGAPFIEEVFEAQDLDTAIAAAEDARKKHRKIDAVVLDLALRSGAAPDFGDGLRKYGGIQVFDKLAAESLLRKNTPIVIQSNYQYKLEDSEIAASKLNVIANISKLSSDEELSVVNGTALRLWTARAFWPTCLPTGYFKKTREFSADIPIVNTKEYLDHLAGTIVEIYDPASPIDNILVEGRSGTGKELLAHCVYFFGPYYSTAKPLKSFACGEVSETLLESELFGHVRGAFTGAIEDSPGFLGRLEENDIVLLDQTEDMPKECQAKLFGILRERRYSRVGSGNTPTFLPDNIRFIVGAGSKKDVDEMVMNDEYRQDIVGRCSLRLYLPPLAGRTSEIRHLVHFYAPNAFRQMLKGRLSGEECDLKVKELSISESAWRLLEQHEWRGNRSGLCNAVINACRRLAIAKGTELQDSHFDEDIRRIKRQTYHSDLRTDLAGEDLTKALAIINALDRHDTVVEAVEEVGIKRNTFYRRARKYLTSQAFDRRFPGASTRGS